jgi:FkbM family methyltransferase
MQVLKNVLHAATGLVGVRVIRTGYGAFGWLNEKSPFLASVLGHPHVFVPDAEHRYRWLEPLGIRTVVDIGAHQGEFARRIHGVLPKAAIVSFEPLPDCYRELQKVTAELPAHRAFNVALGATAGQAEMQQNEFTPASSLLATGPGMQQQLPFAATTRAVSVTVDTLDAAVAKLELRDNLFVKIDVQGFECQVIDGGRETLRRAKLVVVETSFQRIYEGQPLFGAVYDKLVQELGFRYAGSWDQQPSPIDGAPLQEDSIFLRD